MSIERMVTGGTGLVGSQIEGDIKLSSKDVDLRDKVATFDIFYKYRPKIVVHCAARVGGIYANMNNNAQFYYDNIMMNTNVLEACRYFNVEKVILFLSTCIFPDNAEYPLREEDIHKGPPHNSNYGYAYSKRMLEVQARAYNEDYGMNCICLIPTNIFGPNDNFNIKNGHIIPSLIHKGFLSKKDKKPFVVWGSGRPEREFIYSKDVARITDYIIKYYESTNPVILSNSYSVMIKNIARRIADIFNIDSIVFDESMPDGQMKKPTSNMRLCEAMKYSTFEFTKINKALEETIKWFEDNYENARK